MPWKAVLANAFPRIRDIRRARAHYRDRFGRNPRFSFPKTFNEKVYRRKLLDRDPRLPVRADKVLVKKFVEDKLGSEWVIPTLWHGPDLTSTETAELARAFRSQSQSRQNQTSKTDFSGKKGCRHMIPLCDNYCRR